jgi:hypothetical protein
MRAMDTSLTHNGLAIDGAMLDAVRDGRSLERAAQLAAEAADLLRRAAAVHGRQPRARFDCDLTRGVVILCVELTVDRPGYVEAMIAEEHPGAAVDVDATRQASPRIYAALPAVGPHGGAGTIIVARRLAARLKPYGLVGTSSFHAEPRELDDAVREAEFVLDVVRHPGAPVTEDIGNGTYRLLLRMLASHPGELREFYDGTVAAMVNYDEQNRTELVATLRAYLESDCNMNVTAAAVFAHRHTIASRLERIRELTGLDPTRYEDRERLGLGLKVHRLLAPQLESRPHRGEAAKA